MTHRVTDCTPINLAMLLARYKRVPVVSPAPDPNPDGDLHGEDRDGPTLADAVGETLDRLMS